MRLRLLPHNTSINFFGKSRYAIWLSILAVLISFVFYLINGLNYGIDFRGGTMLMIKTSNSSSVSEIRKSLNDLQLGDTVVTKISDPTDTLIGNPKQMFLIKIEQQEGNDEVQNNMIMDVKKTLSKFCNIASLRRIKIYEQYSNYYSLSYESRKVTRQADEVNWWKRDDLTCLRFSKKF